MKVYVGLGTTFHDPAMAVVSSQGELLFAEATERWLQDKRAFFARPDHTLHSAKILKQVVPGPLSEAVIARSWNQATLRRWIASAKAGGDLHFDEVDRLAGFTVSDLLEQNEVSGKHMAGYLGMAGVSTTLRDYTHHLCHAAFACFTSPFQEAACAIFDATGEMTAVSYYTYRDGELAELPVPPSNGSLGAYYSELTEACGFSAKKGEHWKVMGLAAYGKPNPEIMAHLRRAFIVDGMALRKSESTSKLFADLAFRRDPDDAPEAAADLAHSGQQVFCEWARQMLTALQRHTGMKQLALGGGVGLNSSWNGSIVTQTGFDQVYVPPAPADDGNAIGAALLAYRQDNPGARFRPEHFTPYLGSEVSLETVRRAIDLGALVPLKTSESTAVATARLLAEGKIVAWVQGRAEFGPRALGNRSILADPRDPKMKDKINARVKFREKYRPFAPSILAEHGPAFFEDYQEAPYMERALRFKPEVRHLVPAVVHEDGTGRLQTVKQEWNPRYHELISAFYSLTRIPIILNTSLNVMGKPIVHSSEDAIALFYTSGVDVLVIGDYIIQKPPRDNA